MKKYLQNCGILHVPCGNIPQQLSNLPPNHTLLQAVNSHLWEDKRPRLYSDKFEIHIVELPKFANHEYPETPLLNWARFIRAEKKEELEMAAKTAPYIQKAYEQLLYISAD